MQKQAWTWTTPRLPQPARMARWGHFGTPVLIFPTAGGDFEEIERFQLVAALGSLIDGGRIKVYSVDAIATRARLSAATSADELEKRYDSFLYQDVLQRIRSDCQDSIIEPVLVGASLGAATAVSTLCHHPDAFRAAIGLSGVYERDCSDKNTIVSYVTALSGPQLEQLKRRPLILATGAGDYENPAESQRLADDLAAKGLACRFTSWGAAHDHTWSTWRDRLPGQLGDLL